jgi:hypothetical protein
MNIIISMAKRRCEGLLDTWGPISHEVVRHVDQERRMVLRFLLLAGIFALNMAFDAQGVESRDIGDQALNPHSDLIFRATGASSCTDCHGIGKSGGLIPQPLDNDLVRKLRDKAKGIHGPGRFADCLRCHAGGSKGVEKY